jgi:hypothetical protein
MKKLLIAGMMFLIALAVPALALNDWAVLVYMVNEEKDSSSLEEANIRNMLAMMRYGSSDQTKILVQIDRGPVSSSMISKHYPDPEYKGAVRYVVGKDKWGRVAGELGEVNMGSPYALWDFLKWAQKEHPAKQYFLIINSHGSGVFSWRGTGGTSSAKPGAVDFNPDRFVAYDSTDNDCLTVFEMAAVLGAFRDRLNQGRKLDIVAFDACLPAGIEVLYQFRNVCDFLVGSADTTSITGFNYGTLVDKLTRDPAMTAEEAADYTVQRLGDRKLGAWRTSKAQEMAFAVNNISMQLLNYMNETGQKFSLADMTAYGGKERYWDLQGFADSFAQGKTNMADTAQGRLVRQHAQELSEALKAARVNSGYGRMSIAWPTKEEYNQFRAFYKALDLSLSGKWDEVLDRRELGIK